MADPSGVPGTINLLEALRAVMPATLLMDSGATSPTIQWYLKEEYPKRTGNNDATPLQWPNGVIEVLRSNIRGRQRYDKGAKKVPTSQVDPIAFVTGTLSYLVTQQDVEAVQSVTGTVGGSPHTFVVDTDYTVEDTNDDGGLDSIVWTSGGTKPDNATNFTVTYTHRMYTRLWGMDGRMAVRAIIRCKKADNFATKDYFKSTLAETMGDALEMYLRRNSGKVLVKPHASTPVTLTGTAVLGLVLSAGPMLVDDSDTVAGWAVDFQVRLSRVFADPATQAILTATIDQTTIEQ